MRKVPIYLCGALLALSADVAVAQTTSHAEAISVTRKVAASYENAFAKHDAKAIADLFVPDGVFVPPNPTAPLVQGHDAIERNWADLFKTIGGHESLNVLDALPVGNDGIVAINEFKIVGDGANANKTLSGRSTSTLVKTPDGWRYAAIMAQVPPPAK